jgi:hypothetical protein
VSRSLRAAILGFGALLLAIGTFSVALEPSPSSSECARIHLIAGDGDDPSDQRAELNVLLVASGFAAGELDTFRALAGQQAQLLASATPYTEFHDSFNVYRMDVVTPPVSDNCSAGACAAVGPAPPFPTVIALPPLDTLYPTRPESVASPLTVETCWSESGSASAGCSTLWTGLAGQAQIANLALCGPDISVVIVVANDLSLAGGGVAESGPGSIGFGIVGIPLLMDALSGQPAPQLRDEGLVLFAHEVGHTLGLLDEYDAIDSGTGAGSDVEFRDDANVWEPMSSWNPKSPDPPCPAIPWSSEMACPPPGLGRAIDCCPLGLALCCGGVQGHPATDTCPLVRSGNLCGYDASCVISGSVKCDCIDDRAGNRPGLWEGAFYRLEGFYRSRRDCWMKSFGIGTPHCEGCSIALRRRLCAHTDTPQTRCPPPAHVTPDSCYTEDVPGPVDDARRSDRRS